MNAYIFRPDDGRQPIFVHETMEFAAAVLDDDKAFSQIVAAELLRLLRQGKNILVISPKNAQSRGSGGEQ